MAGGIVYGLLATVAFFLSCVICTIAVAWMNTRRDVDHQIPLLKGFLYALVWTLPIVFVIMLVADLVFNGW
jgi:hypothetical protein